MRAAVLLALIFIPTGCVTETVQPVPWQVEKATLYAEDEAVGFAPILSAYALDPALGGDFSERERPDPSTLFGPFHKFGRNTHLHDDGSVTLHYYLEPGFGTKVANLLVGHVKGMQLTNPSTAPPTAINQVGVIASFIKDKRESSALSAAKDTLPAFMKHQHATGSACDLLMVRATNETLVDVENFIQKHVLEVPLIEVKVRILEVRVDDNTQYGITSSITRDTGGDAFFKSLTSHFNTEEMIASGGFTLDDLSTWFDPDRENVNPDFQGSFFIVEGVHDKLRLQAAIELLQRSGEAEILSAPKVRVLNGHKAIIETGSEIPIPQANVTVSSTTYNYKYESTGVTMAIVPLMLMDGSIQLQLTTDVVAITGSETFTTGGGGSVTIPILSNRGASTLINVKEDQAFMLAGLIDSFEIETVSKIPLLGDIPLLGLLFKSRDVDMKKTQVIFYIEPRIIPPTEVIYGLED